MSSSGSGTVINYGSSSDFLTSYGSGYGSGSTSQKVTVPSVPVPVPQHCLKPSLLGKKKPKKPQKTQKTQKKPKKHKKTHWAGFFKKKPGFFPTLFGGVT
jgi:hypothetical protein